MREFQLHPIRDRGFIEWVLPSMYEGALVGWFPTSEEMKSARTEYARALAGIDAAVSEQSPPTPRRGFLESTGSRECIDHADAATRATHEV